jgi:hypothetical protein
MSRYYNTYTGDRLLKSFVTNFLNVKRYGMVWEIGQWDILNIKITRESISLNEFGRNRISAIRPQDVGTHEYGSFLEPDPDTHDTAYPAVRRERPSILTVQRPAWKA